jgi:hypothetical protein
VYPAENRKLATTLAEKGLLLSEFPMGAPPYPQNFPIRNRIVSGMSLGVLVVEGAQYSGSAITCQAGDGPAAGSLRNSGEHHIEDELGPEPANQAGSEAGTGME